MRVLITIFLFTLSYSVLFSVELDSSVAGHYAVESLIQKECIYLETEGKTEMPLEMVSSLLERPDILETIGGVYESMQTEGKAREFRVKKVAEGKYTYVSRKNQETGIEEVARVFVQDEKALVAYLGKGHRFFGAFQVLVQVELTPALDSGSKYNVCVYAYPDSGTIRLFAKIPGVEGYFKRKTTEITELALSICHMMYEQENAGLD